ncbi:MAG: hypothetical protein ACQERU_12850, partial [Bacteroidota bacterium]
KTADNSPKPDPDNVIVQLENMLMARVDYNLKGKGLLIESELANVKLLDFDKAPMIIQTGYDATYELIDSIKSSISTRIDSTELASKRINFKSKFPSLLFTDISVEGLNSKEEHYVRKSIFHGDSVFSAEDLKKKYFKLLADGTISSIYPEAYYNKNTKTFRLNMNVDEESRFVARLGANISSGPINQGFGSIQYNQLGKISRSAYANIYFGRLYSSIMVHARADFPSKIPVAFTGSFTMNRWDYYSSSSDPFFEDVRPPYLIQNENNLKFAVLTPLTTNSLIKAQVSYGFTDDEYYQSTEYFKADTADITKFDYFNFKINIERNTHNYKQFPTEGINQELSLNYLIGNEEFIPGSTSLLDDDIKQKHQWYNIQFFRDKYFRLNKYFYLGYLVQASITNMSFFSNYTSTILNANTFQPTPHSSTMFLDHYRTHSYAGIGIKPIVKLADDLYLRGELYGMLPYKKISSNKDKQAQYNFELNDPTYIASTSLVYQTMFGPASLSLNYYDKSNKKFYFVFNFGYILFNKRGYE